jgi:hypothetical protein
MRAAGKSEKEIRDFQIKSARRDYDAAFEAEKEARDLYNKNIAKASDEDGKKLTENLRKREQATKDSYASYLETGYNARAEEVKAEQQKNEQLAGKAKAAGEARLAERKRELEELRKGLEEARLATLSERDKETSVINSKYDTLKALAVKYGNETKTIEQARAKELLGVSNKYAKEERETKQKELDDALAAEEQQLTLRVTKGEIIESEYQQKLFDVRKESAIKSEILNNENLAKDDVALQQALSKNKTFVAAEIDLEKYRLDQKKMMSEGMRSILLSDLQSRFEALDRENARIDGDFQQDLERIAQQKEILAEQEAIDLQNTELTEFQKTEIRKKYADARIALSDKELSTERAAMQAKHEINMAYLGLFEQFGNVLSQIAGKNKGLAIAGVVVSQAAAIGQIIAQTAIANAKSVAASPLTAGMPWVAINTISAGLSIASTIAGAVKSIQQINSAGESSSGGGAQSSLGSASSAMPSPPAVAAAPTPQIQTQGGNNPSTQLAQTIGGAMKPVRAYVVSQDIQSQTALDRKTNRAATFSGG